MRPNRTIIRSRLLIRPIGGPAGAFKQGLLIAALIAALPASSAGETGKGWNILSDEQGKVTSMSMSVFGTHAYFDIQKEIILQIDMEGNPMGGEIKFVNGQGRPLQQREAFSYWDEYDGAQALWKYLRSKDRVVSIDPQKSEIPAAAFGRTSRIVTGNGKEYFGKINPIPSNPAWFTLEFAGWSLYVYKLNVQAIQQMK